MTIQKQDLGLGRTI